MIGISKISHQMKNNCKDIYVYNIYYVKYGLSTNGQRQQYWKLRIVYP